MVCCTLAAAVGYNTMWDNTFPGMSSMNRQLLSSASSSKCTLPGG